MNGVGSRHLSGVVWPECLATHGPPAAFTRLPRTDGMKLVLAERRRYQAAELLLRPASGGHVDGNRVGASRAGVTATRALGDSSSSSTGRTRTKGRDTVVAAASKRRISRHEFSDAEFRRDENDTGEEEEEEEEALSEFLFEEDDEDQSTTRTQTPHASSGCQNT